MEFPNLGKHCSEATCNKLDFLPIKCDACKEIFCEEHFNYNKHSCPNAYKKNNQVPVCPLCNIPVPVQRGQHPDYIVGTHIDNDCQSDPAKNRRKVFTNKCSLKGCKIKEVIPIICSECKFNYCLKHRHPTDHKCDGKTAQRNLKVQAALARQNKVAEPPSLSKIQGNMSEDEALARALAASMQETSRSSVAKTQEELDFEIARQLQASETTTVDGTRNNRERCNIS